MRTLSLIAILLTAGSAWGQNKVSLLPASSHGKWGYIDVDGSWIIEPQFNRCLPFDDRSYSWAEKDNQSFLIDSKGNTYEELGFSDVVSIRDSVIIFKKGYSYGWFRTNDHQTVKPHFRSVEFIPLSDDLLIRDSMFGVCNLYGDKIVPTLYSEIIFEDDYYIVTRDKLKGIFSKSGDSIVPVQYLDFMRTGNFWVGRKEKSNYDIFNPNGDIIYSGEFESVRHLKEDFFSLRRNKKSDLLGAKDKVLYDEKASNHINIFPGSILIQRPSGFGLFSTNARAIVLNPEYQSIQEHSKNRVLVLRDGEFQLFRKEGSQITNKSYDFISSELQGHLIKVLKNGYWGLIDTNGNQVLPVSFVEINVGEDLIVKASKEGSVSMYELDSNLQFLDSITFNNAQTVQLIGRVSWDPESSNSRIPQSILNRSTFNQKWYQNDKGKWGFRDTVAKIEMPAVFDEITKIRGSEYVIAQINAPVRFRVGAYITITAPSRYAVVDEVRSRILSSPTLLYVDSESVRDSSLQVIRAMTSSGFFITIDKKTGKTLSYGSKYIDRFVDGYARVFVGKELNSLSEPKLMPLINTPDGYCNELGFTYFQPDSRKRYMICGEGYWALIGPDGRYVNHPLFFKKLNLTHLETVRRERLIVRMADTLYGLMSTKGKMVLEPKYKNIEFLRGTGDSLIRVDVYTSKYGYVSATGRTISDPQFSRAEPFSDDFAWAFSDNQTIRVNRSGETKSLDGIFKTSPFSDGYAAVSESYRYALVDSNLTMITDYKFSRVGNYQEGLMPIKQRKGYDYFDSTGNIVLNLKYFKAEPFSHGLALVKFKRNNGNGSMTYGYINKEGGLVLVKRYNRAESINEDGFARVRKSGGYGIVSYTGKEIIPTKHKKIFYGDGVFTGQKTGRFVLYNKKGKKIKSIRGKIYEGYSNQLQIFKRNRKFGFLDTNGQVVQPPQFGKLEPFESGLSAFYSGGKTWVIDTHGDTIQRVDGKLISGFQSGKILIRKNAKYRYVSAKGENTFGQEFDWAEPFVNGLARVRINQKYGLLDSDGFFRIQPTYSFLSKPINGVCISAINSTTGVVNLQGSFVIPPICQEVGYDAYNDVFRFTIRNQYGYMNRNGDMIHRVD